MKHYCWIFFSSSYAKCSTLFIGFYLQVFLRIENNNRLQIGPAVQASHQFLLASSVYKIQPSYQVLLILAHVFHQLNGHISFAHWASTLHLSSSSIKAITFFLCHPHALVESLVLACLWISQQTQMLAIHHMWELPS